jgi:hypothetical protein
MPVTIDEVIAEVAPPEGAPRAGEQQRNKRPDAANQARKHREFLERIKLSAARTRAD